LFESSLRGNPRCIEGRETGDASSVSMKVVVIRLWMVLMVCRYHRDKQIQNTCRAQKAQKNQASKHSLHSFSLFLLRSTNTTPSPKLSNTPTDTTQPRLIKSSYNLKQRNKKKVPNKGHSNAAPRHAQHPPLQPKSRQISGFSCQLCTSLTPSLNANPQSESLWV